MHPLKLSCLQSCFLSVYSRFSYISFQSLITEFRCISVYKWKLLEMHFKLFNSICIINLIKKICIMHNTGVHTRDLFVFPLYKSRRLNCPVFCFCARCVHKSISCKVIFFSLVQCSSMNSHTLTAFFF